jgi:prolipoprotein diacylglyceryltransferase
MSKYWLIYFSFVFYIVIFIFSLLAYKASKSKIGAVGWLCLLIYSFWGIIFNSIRLVSILGYQQKLNHEFIYFVYKSHSFSFLLLVAGIIILAVQTIRKT